MNNRIRAKVARILNSREIVINAGTISGITNGMYFDVMDSKGEDILDPDTGETLGSIDRPKVRVRIIDVQEKLSIASTFKKEVVNVGGNAHKGLLSSYGAFSRALMEPKYVTKYQTLKTEEKTWEDLDEEQSYVKTGDPVVQVVGELQDEDSDN